MAIENEENIDLTTGEAGEAAKIIAALGFEPLRVYGHGMSATQDIDEASKVSLFISWGRYHIKPGQFCVSLGVSSTPRLGLSNNLSDYMTYEERKNEVGREINISKSKGTQKIAAEIRRRLLEPHQKTIATFAERTMEAKKNLARRALACAKLKNARPEADLRNADDMGSHLVAWIGGPIRKAESFDGNSWRVDCYLPLDVLLKLLAMPEMQEGASA